MLMTANVRTRQVRLWRVVQVVRSVVAKAAVVSLAPLLAVAAWPAAAAEPAAASSGGIIGNWASTKGAERLVFSPGGQFHSCFAGSLKGNAAIGRWTRQAPGRYVVEFTHTATPDCKVPAQPIRKHAASIVGQVTVSQGELALYVSGEFPPDLYRAVGKAGLR